MISGGGFHPRLLISKNKTGGRRLLGILLVIIPLATSIGHCIINARCPTHEISVRLFPLAAACSPRLIPSNERLDKDIQRALDGR